MNFNQRIVSISPWTLFYFLIPSLERDGGNVLNYDLKFRIKKKKSSIKLCVAVERVELHSKFTQGFVFLWKIKNNTGQESSYSINDFECLSSYSFNVLGSPLLKNFNSVLLNIKKVWNTSSK